MSLSSGSIKRKRGQDRLEKLKQYGVDLPDIPGLPVQVIPLQVNALDKANQFFRGSTATAEQAVLPSRQRGIQPSGSTTNRSDDSSRNNVMAGIFGRMDQQQQSDAQFKISSRHDTLQAVLEQAVESWLEAVRRFHRDAKNAKSRGASVPLSSFKHLWKMALDDHDDIQTAVPSRRAALYLAAQLLRKSLDCRQWFLETRENLALFIDRFTQASPSQNKPGMSSGTASNSQNQWKLLQKEASLLLSQLVDDGHQQVYPTLIVGLQRFRQQCPQFSLETGAEEQAAAAATHIWRRNRDISLERYQEEERQVRKLVRRAYAAIDVLVPRFAGATAGVGAHAAPDDGDEDSGVDWEDGWEKDSHENAAVEDANNDALVLTKLHASAVQRTIQAMQASVAMQDGGIEISLASAATGVSSSLSPVLHESNLHAKETLERCVKLLETKHLPRLSHWAEGLTKSDNLVALAGGAEGSLATMSGNMLNRRADATRSVLGMKQAVSTLLASAKKLGTFAEHTSLNQIPTGRVNHSLRNHQQLGGPVPAVRPSRSKIRIKLEKR